MTAATYKIPPGFRMAHQDGTIFYNRYGNATRNALEATLASLEGAKHAMAFSCGMAAITALVDALLKQGDHIVASKQMYGGTYGMFRKDLPAFGIEVTYLESNEVSSVIAAVKPNTRLIWLETCSNPFLNILDVEEVAKAVKALGQDGVILGVDNTFLTPYILRPLELGVDLVMHSGSKYLGGHCDILMGFVSTNDDAVARKIRYIQGTRGATPSSFDCYLMQRSLWTLEVRMLRHHETSLKVAKFLSEHSSVEEVIHPLLPSHPFNHLAKTQNKGMHSGMLSFVVKGGEDNALSVLSALRIVTSAVSLGGVHSLVAYPPRTTHYFLGEKELESIGLSGGFIRLSVGLEAADDIVKDLDQALKKIDPASSSHTGEE